MTLSEPSWPVATVTAITTNTSLPSDANTSFPPLDMSQTISSSVSHSSSSGQSFLVDEGWHSIRGYQPGCLVPAKEVPIGSGEDRKITCRIDASSQNFSSPTEIRSHASQWSDLAAKAPTKQPLLHSLSPAQTLKNLWTHEDRIDSEDDSANGDKESIGHRTASVEWPMQEYIFQEGTRDVGSQNDVRSLKQERVTAPGEDQNTVEPARLVSSLCGTSLEMLESDGESESGIHSYFSTDYRQLIETLPSWDDGVMLPPSPDWPSHELVNVDEQRVDKDRLNFHQRNLGDLFKILLSLLIESNHRLQNVSGTAALSFFKRLPSPDELMVIGLKALQKIFSGILPTKDIEVYALLHLALACAIYNNPQKRLAMKRDIFADFLTWCRTVEPKDKSPLAVILYHLWDPYCNGAKDAPRLETSSNAFEVSNDGGYDISTPNSFDIALSPLGFDSDEYCTSTATYVQDAIAFKTLRNGTSVRLCMLYVDVGQFAGLPDRQREPFPRSINTPSPVLEAEPVATNPDQYEQGVDVAPLHCYSSCGDSIRNQISLEPLSLNRPGRTSQTRQSTASSNDSRSSFSSFISDPVMQSPFTQISFDENFADHLDICTKHPSLKGPEEPFVNIETCKIDDYNPPRMPITRMENAQSFGEQQGRSGDSREMKFLPISPARSSVSNSTEGSPEKTDPKVEEFSVKCDKCGTSISGKERNVRQNLSRHDNTVHSNILLLCRDDDCNVPFTRSDNRKVHEETMHKLYLKRGIQEKEVVQKPKKRRKVSAHQPQDSLAGSN